MRFMPSNQPDPQVPDDAKSSNKTSGKSSGKSSQEPTPPADTNKTFGQVVREMNQDAQARKNKVIQHSQQKLSVEDMQKIIGMDAPDSNRRQQPGDYRDRQNPAADDYLEESEPVSLDSAGDHRVPLLPVISTRALAFASWRAGRTLHKQFSALRISKRGLPPDTDSLPDQPVLIYCNHPSIWTASLGMYLATKLWPDWRHYAPAEPEHISRYTLTDKLGLLPIGSGYSGAAHLLRTGQNILCCPGQMLWLPATMTPADPRLRPLPLSRAIPLLARKFDDITILPLAIEHPYRSASLPEALIRFGEPFNAHDAGRRSLQSWHNLLQRRLQMVMDRLAEESADPRPNEFEILW